MREFAPEKLLETRQVLWRFGSIFRRGPRRKFLVGRSIKRAGFHFKDDRVRLQRKKRMPDAPAAIEGGCAHGWMEKNKMFSIRRTVVMKGHKAK